MQIVNNHNLTSKLSDIGFKSKEINVPKNSLRWDELLKIEDIFFGDEYFIEKALDDFENGRIITRKVIMNFLNK